MLLLFISIFVDTLNDKARFKNEENNSELNVRGT